MPSVPQRVLNWLSSVLTPEYADVHRTYNDVANTLAHHPTLNPKTDVYTSDQGTSALLLTLSGTLPVAFRGTTYQFPIAVWVPHAYPREPPIVYVVPNGEMLVRAGQHVDPQGRIYHPYLVDWADYWAKSNILDFLSTLRNVFAKEPPLVARQQQATPSLPQPVPPQRPPHRSDTSHSSPPPAPLMKSASTHAQPPPPPPKPGNRQAHTSATPPRRDNGPPIPPLPAQNSFDSARFIPPSPQVREAQFLAPSGIDHHQYDRPPPPLPPQPPRQQHLRASPSPVSPVTPPEEPYRRSNAQSQHQQPRPNQYSMGDGPQPGSQYDTQRKPPTYNQLYEPYANQHTPAQWVQHQHSQQAPPQQPKPLPPDLLSDSLTVSLAPTTPPIAPPVPPNPERDALLRSIASTLHQQRLASSNQIKSTLPGLHGQQRALQASLAALEAESRALESLSSTIESNTSILHSTIQSADQLIADSTNWKEPQIDELLVAPTVVGNQLYNLVAEERALSDAIFVLGRAKERGRIETGLFIKQTRSLAREWFLKKVLIAKIATGMGLSSP